MGQRLIITVRNHGRDLAKIYYHWSAYTRSALEETKELLDHISQYGYVKGLNEVHPIRCSSCGALVFEDHCEHCGTPHHGHSITEKDFQLVLIRYCEDRGGGIMAKDGELEHVSKMFPGQSFKREGVNRNDGIIALSATYMGFLQSWSEGDIVIDLDQKMICNSVLYCYDSIEDYNEGCSDLFGEDNTIRLKDIPELEYDPEDISFDSLGDLLSELKSLSGYTFRWGEKIYELIA